MAVGSDLHCYRRQGPPTGPSAAGLAGHRGLVATVVTGNSAVQNSKLVLSPFSCKRHQTLSAAGWELVPVRNPGAAAFLVFWVVSAILAGAEAGPRAGDGTASALQDRLRPGTPAAAGTAAEDALRTGKGLDGANAVAIAKTELRQGHCARPARGGNGKSQIGGDES